MASKERPPLTPADAQYVGLARIVGAEAAPVEARHLLRWPSRSRPGKEHFSSCDERGQDVRCTCEAWTYRGACGHAAGHLDALAHHGVTLGPPPAEPGGTPACPDCGRPCDLRDLDDGDPDDVWRWTCDHCETAWPPTRLPVPPADPGGAALDAAQAGLELEYDDWGEAVEMSPEHPGGFWTATAYGPMHVSGDPHMSDETLGALREVAELAVRQHLHPAPNALDAAVAAGGDRWLVSRSATRVTLTCAACYGTIRFTSAVSAPSLLMGSEEAAVRWLANGGVCGCGDAAPTLAQAKVDDEIGDWILGGKLSPPPWLVAPSERRRRHDEAMRDLYGDS